MHKPEGLRGPLQAKGIPTHPEGILRESSDRAGPDDVEDRLRFEDGIHG